MKQIVVWLYNFIVIPVLYLSIHAVSLFTPKIRTGIKGRERLFEELIINTAALDRSKKRVWIHSSSLGEFEQAKPIVEELKKDSSVNVLVSFFSPSGYLNSKKYPYADLVSYLPFDTKSNARKFINIINPDLCIMMRYDIWPNHVWAMKESGVVSFIVDATMKQNSTRKYPVIKGFHQILFKDIHRILTVSDSDKAGFLEFGCTEQQIKAVGDTRFDRVYQRSINAKNQNLIRDEILKDKKVLVAGSTWEADENVILPAFVKAAKYDPDILLIIAPHEPTVLNIDRLENELSGQLKSIRFSHLNNYKDERVIIVDSIGILLTLYTYADIAFVGGSFKQNIHNILEAAVYGVPVLFGPKIDNSQESQQLMEKGSGIMIRNKKEAYRQFRTLFSNKDLRKSLGAISYNYVQDNLGATEKILKEVYQVLS